jgi:lipopolysaccharide transport system ATP-binding protein
MNNNSPAILVNNLGKKYTIAKNDGRGYKSMRDSFATKLSSFSSQLRRPFNKFQDTANHLYTEVSYKQWREEFWAVKNLSFQISKGDRVGIIGRNGAGKSTLLKLLSRITEPTSGRIELYGRVASLLEVGTGFHPELTGRENIFLNGSILGMSRREIVTKFDEIVEFAEVHRFVDTPVKRYSSGMYVRLAFAVAAHLDPEILIIDEVLAVGDAAFQKKCLAKMEDISYSDNKTLLFVSHNIPSVKSLCNKAMLLSNGNIKYYGDVDVACQAYEKDFSENNSVFSQINSNNGSPYIAHAEIYSCAADSGSPHLTQDDDIYLAITVESEHKSKGLHMISFLHSPLKGGRILMLRDEICFRSAEKTYKASFTYKIPSYTLMPGFYSFELGIMNPPTEYLDHGFERISFEIKPGLQADHDFHGRDLGILHRSVVNKLFL